MTTQAVLSGLKAGNLTRKEFCDMKWQKAINQIRQALDEGKIVEIIYHRKWMKNDSHIEQVESLSEYQWNGWIRYAVNLFHDQIYESTHIIDEVRVQEGE